MVVRRKLVGCLAALSAVAAVLPTPTAMAAPDPPLAPCDRILYADQASLDVMSIGIDGSDPTELIDFAGKVHISPDGQKMAYLHANQVFVSNLDGTDERWLSEGFEGGSHITWSPDSRRVAWRRIDRSSYPWQSYHVVADVATGARADIDGPIDTNRLVYSNLAWSPDGSRLAYVFSESSGHFLRTMRSDGSGLTSAGPFLSSPTLRPVSVFFTPDSSSLLFGRITNRNFETGAHDSDVVTVSFGGSVSVVLDNAEPVDMTHDGRVLVRLFDELTRFYALDLSTGAVEAETPPIGPWSPYNPSPPIAYSADGRSAVSTVDNTIYLFDVGGETATPVVDGTSPQLVPCPPFTDISRSSFAVDDVALIYRAGITQGTSSSTYGPADFVTREQMAAFLARLWRALGNECSGVVTPFGDVAGSFAAADVACIFGLGITRGTSASSYGPSEFVTREQMAAFLARLWRAA